MRVLTAEQQALAEKNINLAYYFAHKYWAEYRVSFEDHKISVEDVRGEAMVGLCEAIAAYVPDKGALATVVGVNIKHKCLNLLNKGASFKRVANSCRCSRSLDAPVGDPKTRLTLGDVVADKRDDIDDACVGIDLMAGINTLPSWQRDLTRSTMAHQRQVDLAKRYGRSQRWVSTELKAAREKLRKYMEDAI